MAKSRKQQIQEMLAHDPDDAFLRYALGMEHTSGGDDTGAVEQFRRLIRVNPDYVPAYLQCGQALMRLGEVADARQALQQGVAVAHKAGDAHAAGEMEGLLMTLTE